MANKDIKKLVRELQKQGFHVEETGKNYHQVFDEGGRFVVRIPSTPSSRHTIGRIRAKLRKHGFTG